MLSARGPFTVIGGDTADDNLATLECEPNYPTSYFSPNAIDLMKKLFIKDPTQRLGHGPNGAQDIMAHPFFESIDWSAMQARAVRSPWQPKLDALEKPKRIRPRSDQELARLARIRLSSRDHARYVGVPFVSQRAVAREMVQNFAVNEAVEELRRRAASSSRMSSLKRVPTAIRRLRREAASRRLLVETEKEMTRSTRYLGALAGGDGQVESSTVPERGAASKRCTLM
jgi:serine/threonine protein kinase